MKLNLTSITFVLAIALMGFWNPTQAQNKDLPNVVILATGGTIAGASNSATNASYSSGQVGIQTMIEATPGVEKLANVTGEQVSNVGSQDMTIDIWLKLANRINELLKQDDVDGIVITHGTDTQEETSYFLSLTVKSDKPVVMTGSMRSSTSLSAEGPLNLYNAVAVAASPAAKGKGVMVALNDYIHSARDVQKMNTTNVAAFESPIKGAMGTVFYGDVKFYRTPTTNFGKTSIFDVSGVTSLPRVDIIYGCADLSGDILPMHVKAGAKGIVIAGVGNGNIHNATLDAGVKAVKNGVPVVRSAKVPSGYVLRNGEVIDDETGTVASGDLNPVKSRILLMLALHANIPQSELQELFNNY